MFIIFKNLGLFIITLEKDKEFSVYVDKDYEFNAKDLKK